MGDDDDLDDEERAKLHEAFDRSLSQAKAGHLKPMASVVADSECELNTQDEAELEPRIAAAARGEVVDARAFLHELRKK